MARARGLWACALLFVTAFFSLGVLAQEAAPKETPGPRTESAEKASMLSDSGLLRLVNREKLITMAYEPGTWYPLRPPARRAWNRRSA